VSSDDTAHDPAGTDGASIERALATLAGAPRMQLGHWPTPLEPCHRLREQLGGPLVWLKRDDCSGLAMGGNKTRKLEYLLGAALAQGCTGVVTFGALQSNHARQTAAACARAGLSCDLVLTRAVDRDDVHYVGSGNVVLDRVLGAALHVVDDPDSAFVRFAELLDAAEGDGRRLYGIVPGGSDPVGTLGYVTAGLELVAQLSELSLDPQRLVVAASTTGTAAGLLVGTGLAGDGIVGSGLRLDVVCVYHDREQTAAELAGLVTASVDALGAPAPDTARLHVDDSQLGDGYGIPTDACLEAIELLARTEGVLLDPVYSSKAFAHLIRAVRHGELDDDRPVVFVHTGGSPGLFAYASQWTGAPG
jgi:D-cysteine desulfhydrase family pyridoxal phosphate-dependent enzyme